MRACFPYTTRVVTAAGSRDLTLKAKVKTELNIDVTTWDDQIDDHIHRASAAIARFCQREFPSERLEDKFRTPASTYGAGKLWLSRAPVTTIHSVVEDGATLTADDYELASDSGELWRLDGSGNRRAWAGGALVVVEHTAGFALLSALPYEIEAACIQQVKASYRAAPRDPTLRSRSMPDVMEEQYNVAGGTGIGASGLLLDVEGALLPWRRWVVA